MRKIQFGAGSLNISGFENYEQAQIDITQPLPFKDGEIDVVFAEMVLEHITPQQAWSFIEEAYRVLKPGGKIRLVIPDFVRCFRLQDPDWLRVNQGVTNNNGTLRDQMKSIIFGHGHQGLWSAELLQAVLSSIGFTGALIQESGVSSYGLDNLEQHGHSVGFKVAAAESGCVEALK